MFKVFINIPDINISDNRKKDMCLSFNAVPN